MISLRNVSKEYVSKSKHKVQALQDVSLELGEKGLVFVLGKSGSGKSTLLNLLGGLDNPTDGEIVVDGTSMKNFKRSDYDGYRNGYVGFVFQEFNLIDDFDVKGNVALALQLERGSDIQNKVSEALQMVELPQEYLSHRVGELSGGEKQRVAIARCIVKDSKMILADEPTGNLDSATGEAIWNILKKLSETRLVVVVSHDRESAEKYADRTIEIADGRIISDTDDKSASDVGTSMQPQQSQGKFAPQKKHLPFKVLLKMAWNSLFRRKGRALCVLFVSFFTMLALLFTEMLTAFSPNLTYAKFISDYDVPHIKLCREDENGRETIFNDATLQYLDDNSEILIQNRLHSDQDIIDFGLGFVGEHLPLDDNSYYLSEKFARQMEGTKVIWVQKDDGTFVQLEDNIENYVGQHIYIFPYLIAVDGEVPVFAGLVSEPLGMSYGMCDAFFSTENFKFYYEMGREYNQNDVVDKVELCYNSTFSEMFSINKYDELGNSERGIATAEGYLIGDAADNFTLQDNELVLNFELYQRLFDCKGKLVYVDATNTFWYDSAKTLPHIGESFELGLKDHNGNYIVKSQFVLKGVIFERNPNNNKYLAANLKTWKNLTGPKPVESVLVKTDSVTNMRVFLDRLGKDNCVAKEVGGHYKKVYEYFGLELEERWERDFSCTTSVDNFVLELGTFIWVFVSLTVALVAILLLLVINLISFSISDRKREIGILSALGTSDRDIVYMFLLEILFVAIICFVLVFTAYAVFSGIFNNYFAAVKEYPEGIVVSYFNINFLAVATLIVACFGLLLLAAWIPAKKISKRKPIDAIRNK